MKYVVILGDGMSDYPLTQLQGKTPLQHAYKPAIDELAMQGEVGMVKTVPEGMEPGSDTANLSVLGYDPRLYYPGRSPFEAVSMGLDLDDSDVTYRCNLVTLSTEENYCDKKMLDHSGGEISSEEARELIEQAGLQLKKTGMDFYPGISYRNLLVWRQGPESMQLTPPHDIIGCRIGKYLPSGKNGEAVLEIMEKSSALLSSHPVNKRRERKGLPPANSLWLWGRGKKPCLPSFHSKYGLRGAVIAAVDLIKGIGACAGLKVISVPGVTGNINTNFAGKAEAALSALRSGLDFVFLHLEAPDECAHMADVEGKVKAIELLDQKIVRAVREGLDKEGWRYRVMVLPDHATPVSLRTHTADPVPFLVYDNSFVPDRSVENSYDEASASRTGLYLENGYMLMDYFLGAREKGQEMVSK